MACLVNFFFQLWSDVPFPDLYFFKGMRGVMSMTDISKMHCHMVMELGKKATLQQVLHLFILESGLLVSNKDME